MAEQLKVKRKKVWNKSRVCTLIANILIYTFVAVVSLSCVLPYIHVLQTAQLGELCHCQKGFPASKRFYHGSIR